MNADFFVANTCLMEINDSLNSFLISVLSTDVYEAVMSKKRSVESVFVWKAGKANKTTIYPLSMKTESGLRSISWQHEGGEGCTPLPGI